jgi:hypothetical protein
MRRRESYRVRDDLLPKYFEKDAVAVDFNARGSTLE